jgi:uncharacterized protein GlcG (DUF336 family)
MELLTLTQANKIVEAALAKAHELGLKPMTVAVLDAGGHLVAFNRQDRSSILRPQIAQAKAWGAVGMGLSGRALAERAASHGAFVNALGTISEGRIAPVPGGVLILDKDDNTLGSVGISGDLPDKDEACAIAGIEAVQLKPGV